MRDIYELSGDLEYIREGKLKADIGLVRKNTPTKFVSLGSREDVAKVSDLLTKRQKIDDEIKNVLRDYGLAK